MAYDIGENLVGTYLSEVVRCDFVIYNTQLRTTQGEIDVLGLKLQGEHREILCCEVATHLEGLEYGTGYAGSARKIRERLERAHTFAEKTFPHDRHRFEFWCPRVPVGTLSARLDEIVTEWSNENRDLTFVVNEQYARRVQDLIDIARGTTKATSDPVFRLLQVLTHVRGTLSLAKKP